METIVPALANIIETSVAPVFLLAGIAGFLNVMSGRFGRVADLVRAAEKNIAQITSKNEHARTKKEISLLWRRVKVINWAIGFCTASAFLVCSVIVCLFTSELWSVDLKDAVVILFILTMLMLMVALLLSLIEVSLATKTIRVTRTVK